MFQLSTFKQIYLTDKKYYEKDKLLRYKKAVLFFKWSAIAIRHSGGLQ
jgi:hypothetical protein